MSAAHKPKLCIICWAGHYENGVCTSCHRYEGATSHHNRCASRLHRAAPDLLEACELAEATIERLDRHGSGVGTLDVVRAAIARAKP